MSHSTVIYLENTEKIKHRFQAFLSCSFSSSCPGSIKPITDQKSRKFPGDNPDFLKILEKAVDSMRIPKEFHLASDRMIFQFALS